MFWLIFRCPYDESIGSVVPLKGGFNLGPDSDYKSYYSKRKQGGYQWAGGWIDPSVPLQGYKEHPTMDIRESFNKHRKFLKRARDWKVQRQLYQMQEGSNY